MDGVRGEQAKEGIVVGEVERITMGEAEDDERPGEGPGESRDAEAGELEEGEMENAGSVSAVDRIS